MKLFFFVLLVSFTSVLSAQLSVENTVTDLLPIEEQTSLEILSVPPPDLKQALLGMNPSSVNGSTNLASLRYEQHLAFFCRVEAKNDKAAKMPVRFRLGSVDYVDYLEGKRDYSPRQ